MNTIETVIVWSVFFAIMTGAVFLGISTARVTFSQIGKYEESDHSAKPAEITRLVEVIYETIDNI